MPGLFDGKKILVGVTGGIAAYKAAELVRLFVKAGAETHVVMTKSATQFVAPLTFQTLSQHRVHLELFDLMDESEIGHIRLAQTADLVVIAPATANILGKAAGGIADDLLATILLATDAPILAAPAMNDRMWANAAVTENVARLRARGWNFVDPESGDLACKTVAVGRLAEPETIFAEAGALLAPKILAGKRVVVTAGPTVEPIDDVRVLTNRSSGKMGMALAAAARERGASVTVIHGPVSAAIPPGVECVRVGTAAQMLDAIRAAMRGADMLVMCAAVADFRPAKVGEGKVAKSDMAASIALTPNPDLVATIRKEFPRALIVGFAAQTDAMMEKGGKKLREKDLDFVVVNDVSKKGVGFDADENEGFVLGRDGSKFEIARTSKLDFARTILDRVAPVSASRKRR